MTGLFLFIKLFLQGDYNMASKVFFSRNLDGKNITELYKIFDGRLKGKVAIKLHSGEEGNQNFLKPEYLKDVIDYVGGTVVECNTAYDGERNTTEKHLKTLESHGWSRYFDVDLLDKEQDDLVLMIPNGKVLKKNYVGKDLTKYDSLLVLSHFKGHPMGGYGGALKQLSIGIASSRGKAWIHSGGKTTDQYHLWEQVAPQDTFLEAMADAASSVVNYFHGNAIYINIMKNMSVDCDCCAVAEDPCMKDIGILISDDPIAIDQACIDLVMKSNDPGKAHFMERVNTRHGIHTIEAAEKLDFGSREYELIEVNHR